MLMMANVKITLIFKAYIHVNDYDWNLLGQKLLERGQIITYNDNSICDEYNI